MNYKFMACFVLTLVSFSVALAAAGEGSEQNERDSVSSVESPADSTGTVLAAGVFIGKIEEGARIFTPVRLLPFEHPDSEGHEFPNALQLHQSEYEAIVYLGELAGLRLATTLQRYPKQPTSDWWYDEFEECPVDKIKAAEVHKFERKRAPVPGLRAVAFINGQPAGFIVDTRDLSLEKRGMTRATAMGLELNREQFLSGLQKATKLTNESGDAVFLFE